MERLRVIKHYTEGKVSDIPWWAIDGARPVLAWSPEDGAWQFSSGMTSVSAPYLAEGITVGGVFAWCLSDEQIVIVHRLMCDDKMIFGRYETWEQFCEVHGLSNGY